jgi:uncharacterized membrane protein (DUF373 family)
MGADMPRYLAKVRDLLGRPRTIYEGFEHLVILALNFIVAVIVGIALVQLFEQTLPLVLRGALNPLDRAAFESIFSGIFTLIIALEFRHSIARAADGREHVVQVRTVVLIALLAISRKFVILDTATTSAATIAALAAVTVVLGVVYWLLRADATRPPPRAGNDAH